MERLAMNVAGPHPVTSAGNQYCLMVGCYFMGVFPHPGPAGRDDPTRQLVLPGGKEVIPRVSVFHRQTVLDLP